MDLTVYDIIKGPVITDKAFKLNRDLKQLVLNVHMHANKPLVKLAIEKLFGVKVEDVRVLVRKGKNRRVKGKVVQGSDRKIAFVSLAEGYQLDLFDQGGTGATVAPEAAKQTEKDIHSEK